jgi:hypothetical protein
MRMHVLVLGGMLACTLAGCSAGASSNAAEYDAQSAALGDSGMTKIAVDSVAAPEANAEIAQGGDDWAPLKPEAERQAILENWRNAFDLEIAALKDPKTDEWLQANRAENAGDEPKRISEAELKAMTAQQLLYYALQNPEEYSQICAEFAAGAGLIQALSRKLPYDQNGDLRSDRQTDALQAKHKQVERLVADLLRKNKTVSQRMLFHIADLELHACILPLIDIYRSQQLKDDLILTTLSELMERGEGFEWLKSDVFKTMLLDAHYIAPLTAANAEEVISYAQRYVVNAKEDQWK